LELVPSVGADVEADVEVDVGANTVGNPIPNPGFRILRGDAGSPDAQPDRTNSPTIIIGTKKPSNLFMIFLLYCFCGNNYMFWPLMNH
jgi:hypothetical protein